MPSPLIFDLYTGTSLYLTDLTQEKVSFAYFFSADNTVPPPPSIDIEGSWSTYLGVYIFLGKEVPIGDLQTFSATLSTFFTGQPLIEHTGVMWLDDYKTLGQPSIITTTSNAEIKETVNISIGTYSVSLTKNSSIYLIPAQQKLVVAYPELPGAQAPVYGEGTSIPLSGSSIGTMQFEGAIGDCSDALTTGWNIGIKYFYFENATNLVQLQYPIFDLPKGYHILFAAQWDPLHPLDPTRTFLHFKKGMLQIAGDEANGFFIVVPPNSTWLPSTFRTIYGHHVHLVPELNSSANIPSLVFQPLPGKDGTNNDYYLVPSGDFCLAVEDTNSQQDTAAQQDTATQYLLAGLMGTEFISFTPKSITYKGDRIRFTPGSPAFAPVFPLEGGNEGFKPAEADCKTGDLLCSTYLTAWAGFQPDNTADIPNYYSQPETSPLFLPQAQTNTTGTDTLTIMDIYPAPAAAFPPKNTAAFPLVPYSSAKTTQPNVLRPFELSILNPWRKKHITQNAARPTVLQDDPKITTTPQGLLATIEGYNWTSVLLAQNETSGRMLQFTGALSISPPIQNALQTNQLFLVVTLAKPLQPFSNEIDIEGWPFTINPQGSAGSYSNVFIFKFCSGSLQSRAADTKTWTNAPVFNTDPSAVSTWIGSYISDAANRAKQDSRYDNFVDIVTSETWNGIIALQVDIGLDDFPDDIKGLLGGIDLSQFNGHHFGIDVNYVQLAAGKLTVPKSSLFGLISYYDAAYARANGIITGSSGSSSSPINPGADGYNFTVLYLQVVFNNSVITDFNSLIQLSATSWFGEPAVSNCTIDLIGSYEEHDNKPTYSFTTKKNQYYQFYMNSKVMNYVQIVKARFNTNIDNTSPTADATETTPISSTFSFWGYINFNQLAGFDPFSFGDPVPTPGSMNSGLYFYNLAVNMNFNLVKDPGPPPSYSTTHRAFNFAEKNTSFDTSLSTVHDQSLYPNFPLTITALTGSNAGTTTDQGYINIELPETADFGALGANWYGLVCTLNLGSMGALASLAGFTARLLIAWSASTNKPAVALGIRLPGTGGAKGFSFENVLQLSIDAFILAMDTTTTPGTTVYSLWLRSIGLSLLGIKFPPSGSTNLILYGNPDAPGQIGWYGQYTQKS